MLRLPSFVLIPALLVPFASVAQTPPELAEYSWTSTSRDGKVAVIQEATAPGACVVRCLRDPGQKELWRAEVCLARRDQVRVFTDDCERLLLFEVSPQQPGPWGAQVVVTAYERTTPKAQVLLADLFADDKKLMKHRRGIQWLAGDARVAVPAPDLAAEGPERVVFKLVDGRAAAVAMDGTLLEGKRPVPPPAKATKRKKGR